MTPPTSEDEDTALRALLSQADPARGQHADVPEDLLARVSADLAEDTPAAGPTAPGARAQRDRSFLSRHWQGGLLAAAGVASLAIGAATVLPGLIGTSGGDAAAGQTVSSQEAATSDSAAAGRAQGANELVAGGDSAAAGAAPAATPTQQTPTQQTLVRSASVLVGTDDIEAGRASFVAAIEGMGGMVMSETVTSQDGSGGGAPEPAGDLRYPTPYPTGPGVWLTVQVPASQYDAALAAARATGEVVQLQQSSYDVGTQVTDVNARIKALESSIERLEALMDDATGVSDVIKLESAISARQSELDSLRAQQRELANQTEKSQISLTLQSPEDARGSLDPAPPQTWWESFLAGLSQFWSWLGQALLIAAPLLTAGAVIWWIRRRRAGRPGPSAAQAPDQP